MTKTDAEISAAIGQAIKARSDKLATKHEREAEGRNEQNALVEEILKVSADFDLDFEAEVARLRAEAKAKSALELTSALDELSARFTAIEKHLTQNAAALPGYEVRRIQESLRKQREEFQSLQSDLQPKKKFGFRGKKSKKTDSEVKETKVAKDMSELTQAGYILQDQTGGQVTVSRDLINNKDGLFKNLTNVEVKILGNPSTLHFSNIKDCVIVSGPVSTSIFIEDCVNCKCVMACQQLRTHNAVNTQFYLHVTSKAIVEDCSGLAFAPFPYDVEDSEALKADYEASGLDRTRNNWDKVDDFNWLASDKASPNWKVLAESDRLTFDRY